MSTNVGEIDLSLILDSNKFSSQLKNIDAQANTASAKISSSLLKIGKAALAAFSVAAVVKWGKECLNVATETSNAWIGLNSILTGQGKSFDKAKQFINDYISDGLVPLNNAVAAYKNLTLRGYNSDQIQKTMNALKNSATFARQSTYSLGDAVQTATEGLKNENSVVVDNAGVTKNVAKMWEDYAKSIGKTTNNLTQAEKIQAEVNGILKETKFQSNDATIYAQTYSGKLAQLNTAFTTLKTSIGNVIQSLGKLFIPIITSAVNAVTKLFTAIAGLLSLFGLKADSVETVSNGIGDMANSASNASDAISGIGDSASKAAKKIKNSLAGFDEINKLDDNSDSNSGDSGSSGAGAISPGIDFSKTDNQFSQVAEKMKATLEKIFEPLKKAWEAEGQNVIDAWHNALDGIKTLMGAIGKSFAEIWTNGTAQTTIQLILKGFADILNIIGNVSRAFANAWNEGGKGTSIIQNLANAFNNVLAIIESVLRTFAEWWKTDKAQAFANSVVEIFEIISGWIENLTANLKKIWENGGEHAFTSLLDAGSNLTQIFEKVLEALDPLVQGIENALGNAFSNLLDAVGWVLDKFNEFGDWLLEHDGIIQGVTYTVLGFMAAWEVTKLMAFIQQSGGLIATLGLLKNAILGNVAAKIADKAETIALTLMYAKDFVVSLASGTAALVKQAAQWVINTAMKVADTAATVASTAATVAATAATWLFNAALAVLTSPITLVVVAIGALIAVIVLCVKHWDEIKTKVTEVVENIKEKVNELKDKVVEKFTELKERAQELWGNIKTAIIEKVTNLKESAINKFNEIKDGVVQKFTNIKTKAQEIWDNIKSTITDKVDNVKTNISNALNNIKTTWSNIWEGMKNTVTNIFKGIWDAIKGVINSILGGIEAMANGIVRGVNKIIDTLNNLNVHVPDWVPLFGGKDIGFHINPMNEVSLPRLAQGGYVKANTPKLAVIGDNKTQGEIVAPENKMLEMVLTALKMFKAQENREDISNGEFTIQNNIILDGEVIQRNQFRRSDRMNLATNGRCS